MDQKKNKKKPNGRIKLDPSLKRERFYIYLNQNEREALSNRVSDSVYDNSSGYIRSIILKDNNKARHVNPVGFLSELSNLMTEINKVGVNINQISKHLNEMALLKTVPHPNIIKAIETNLEHYTKQQQEVLAKLKEVMFS